MTRHWTKFDFIKHQRPYTYLLEILLIQRTDFTLDSVCAQTSMYRHKKHGHPPEWPVVPAGLLFLNFILDFKNPITSFSLWLQSASPIGNLFCSSLFSGGAAKMSQTQSLPSPIPRSRKSTKAFPSFILFRWSRSMKMGFMFWSKKMQPLSVTPGTRLCLLGWIVPAPKPCGGKLPFPLCLCLSHPISSKIQWPILFSCTLAQVPETRLEN